jgi:hypothetical protein
MVRDILKYLSAFVVGFACVAGCGSGGVGTSAPDIDADVDAADDDSAPYATTITVVNDSHSSLSVKHHTNGTFGITEESLRAGDTTVLEVYLGENTSDLVMVGNGTWVASEHYFDCTIRNQPDLPGLSYMLPWTDGKAPDVAYEDLGGSLDTSCNGQRISFSEDSRVDSVAHEADLFVTVSDPQCASTAEGTWDDAIGGGNDNPQCIDAYCVDGGNTMCAWCWTDYAPEGYDPPSCIDLPCDEGVSNCDGVLTCGAC